MSYLPHTPIELVTRHCWAKHLTSRPTRPPVLPVPQRQKKPLVVEVVFEQVPLECVWKTNVEIAEQATCQSQQPPQQQSVPVPQVRCFQTDVAHVEKSPDARVPQQTEKQQTVEKAADVPAANPLTEPASVQQRTNEQVADVSAGEWRGELTSVQQRTDEQVVDVSAGKSRGKSDSVTTKCCGGGCCRVWWRVSCGDWACATEDK